jgi:hypothetical protein
MAGIVSNSRETMTSILIEREHLARVLGDEDMLEHFNFGGMSGGPLLAIVQAEIMRTWRPAGVIVQGPNPGDAANRDAIPGLEIMQPTNQLSPGHRESKFGHIWVSFAGLIPHVGQRSRSARRATTA